MVRGREGKGRLSVVSGRGGSEIYLRKLMVLSFPVCFDIVFHSFAWHSDVSRGQENVKG